MTTIARISVVAVLLLFITKNGLSSFRKKMVNLQYNLDDDALMREVIVSMNSRLFMLEKRVQELGFITEVNRSEEKDFQQSSKDYPDLRMMLEPDAKAEDLWIGDNVYFECLGRRNESTVIFQDNKELKQDSKRRILKAADGVILQGVDRTSIGNYTCSQGTALSKTIPLVVKSPPVCITTNPLVTQSGEEVIDMEMNKTYTVPCEVDSVLPVVQFMWTFTSFDSEHPITIPEDQYITNGTKSILTYSPKNTSDYGLLNCWASNAVGDGVSHSCKYLLFEIKKPNAPYDCRALPANDTIIIACDYNQEFDKHYGRRIPQRFSVEILDSNGKTVFNQTEKYLNDFNFHELNPGTRYEARIFAFNLAGRSASAIIPNLGIIKYVKPSKPTFSQIIPTMKEGGQMTYDIECYVDGGDPPPKLYFINGYNTERLEKGLEISNQSLPDSDVIRYIIKLRNYTFELKDHGGKIWCFQEHITLWRETDQDERRAYMPINIEFAPRLIDRYEKNYAGIKSPLSLDLGWEGHEIYSWLLAANPPANITWFLNGTPLPSDVVSQGVKASGPNMYTMRGNLLLIKVQVYKIRDVTEDQILTINLVNEIGASNYIFRIKRS